MDNQPAQNWRGLIGMILVRAIVPLYVLFGAASKWYSATPEKLPDWMQNAIQSGVALEWQYDVAMWLLKGFIGIELLAVVAMVFFARFARPVALIILAAFALVALLEVGYTVQRHDVSYLEAAFSGDCGCFGSAVAVPPGVMAIIDATLLALVATLRPRRRETEALRPPLLIGGVLAGALALALATNPQMHDLHGNEARYQKYQPNFWTGWKFEETGLYEWVGYAIDPATFGGGRQTWILYRKSCPTCQELFKNEYSEPTLDRTVVAVHVPPLPHETFDEEPEEVVCPACQFAELTIEAVENFSIPVPVIIEIDETGTITKVTHKLLTGQPTNESGTYEHGTEEMEEDWRRQLEHDQESERNR